MSDELTWYVARSSGLVAWSLLAGATIWGLLVTSRVLERRPSRAWLIDLHRHLGWLTLVFTAVHMLAIYVDDFVSFTAIEMLVPLTSDFETNAVAWGVVALYLLVAVQVTSWLRGRMPAGLWRAVHWLSPPLLVVVSIHAVTVGTDVSNPYVAVPAIVIAAELVLLGAVRLGHRRATPRSAG